MRNVTADTLTRAFMDYCAAETDPRLRSVLTSLATHLHAFVKETGLTHAEWRKGIELLTKAGQITDEERNEFVLFSDVLGVSSLVDMVNSPADATSSSVLGPFHVLGAPELPVGGDLLRDNDGMPLIIDGRVKDRQGRAIAGANIEIWQTADNGLYSNQDPAQAAYNLRASMTVGDDGRYGLSTVRPAPYMVPTDGPVGELLNATGRDAWRPSHLHFIIQAPGYRTLVTEVFPSDDPYLDKDAVFGVREDLVMDYVECNERKEIPEDFAARDTIPIPFCRVSFDFTLCEAGSD
jgi:hydroxyquinol 1,2-dioxygenase